MTRADEIQLVTPELVFWQAYEPSVKADLCSSAVRTAQGWALIDPIDLTAEALAELREIAEPALIILTNGNHARAAAALRKRLAIPVAAHPDAIAELGIEVDRTIEDSDLVAGDLRVIRLPGAPAGEIALCRPGHALNLGDALINLPPHGFTFLPDKYCIDPRLMRESLRKLLDWEFQQITFAHGQPLVKDSKAQLTRLLA
jgi:hypothetical protein